MKHYLLFILCFISFCFFGCEDEEDVLVVNEDQARVTLSFRLLTNPYSEDDIESYGTIRNANGYSMTDLIVMDFDKNTGELIQTHHQTSKSKNFGVVEFAMDKGSHVIKAIATRSKNISIAINDGRVWQHSTNLTIPFDGITPFYMMAENVSDTFAGECNVDVEEHGKQDVMVSMSRKVSMLGLVVYESAIQENFKYIEIEIECNNLFDISKMNPSGSFKEKKIYGKEIAIDEYGMFRMNTGLFMLENKRFNSYINVKDKDGNVVLRKKFSDYTLPGDCSMLGIHNWDDDMRIRVYGSIDEEDLASIQ